MLPRWLSSVFGYDRALLERLPPAAQRALEHVAEAWLLSCALLAAPVGYAVYQVEHALGWALAAALGAGLFVLNALRLIGAGAGAAPRHTRAQVQRYRPALGATGLLTLLALLFAQPAQLPLWERELAVPLAQHRQQLLAEREHAGPQSVGALPEQLARCGFLALRLQLIWRQPARALRLSGLYWLLVLLPALGARYYALSALRAYELLRWEEQRRSILEHTRACETERQRLLSVWPSYAPLAARHADAPFDTRLLSPLLRPRARARRRWFGRGGAA